MQFQYPHLPFNAFPRRPQSLSNDRCQNILYKAIFEHFKDLHHIAALLLTSKSFQNSSFGANFLVNFVVNKYTIDLLESLLSPTSCFSLQFVPSLHVRQPWVNSEKIRCVITNFVETKYLHLSLRSLTLNSVMLEGISAFFGNSTSNSWPQLQDLSLEHCDLNDAVLKIVSTSAHQLRTVSLSGSSGFTEIGLCDISKLSHVTSLDLAGCNVVDAGLEQVSKLSGITSLHLWGWGTITDDGLEHLSKLSSITELDFYNSNLITDAGLEHLSSLSTIKSLTFRFCYNITDAGLEHISFLSNIATLDLDSCSKITDGGLEHLTKLSRIASLKLRACDKITDAGLEHISKLSTLTSLDLSYCYKIANLALQHISKLSNITSLNLSWCKETTDAGLEHLATLTRITSLDLAGCSLISSAAKKKFASKLPNCYIIG